MQNTKDKSLPYKLKKQAVFDALYKSCEINGKDQVSLASVLHYISKEIDSKFKNSEHMVSDLKQTLNDKNVNGWLSFAETCTIFSNWMDKISCKSQRDTSKTFAETIEQPYKLKLERTLKTFVPAVRKCVLNDPHENEAIAEILCPKCEKCGKEENCCEWRKNEISREEKITRCFEQKVTELQNLLRQSEDCNYLIQLENESLQQKYSVLQSKEKRWIEKEEKLLEQEQQITSSNMLLKEQNATAEKEIQQLKTQLNRLKNENGKLLSQNFILEERVTDISRMEKLLVEARLKQSQMQLDIESKDAFLAEVEIKLENLQQYNKILEKQIDNMENRKLQDASPQDLLEQHVSEELTTNDVKNKISCENNGTISLDILAENSLKAELDACWGQWPLSCEHVATQVSPTTYTSATQTDQYLLENEEMEQKKYTFKNIAPFPYKQYNCEQHSKRIYAVRDTAAEISESIHQLNCLMDSASIEHCTTLTFASQVGSCLYVPLVQRNVQMKMTCQFCSKYEMELFTLIDATTQTESPVKGRNERQIIENTSNFCELVPKGTVSDVVCKKRYISFLYVNLS